MDDVERERIQAITAHLQTMFTDLFTLCHDIERVREPEQSRDRADDRRSRYRRQRMSGRAFGPVTS
jgi:hypothetical protein